VLSGYQWAFAVGGTFSLLGAVVAVLGFRKHRTRARPAGEHQPNAA
jgi:hypothetical protein